jgi:uncharacterized membrane protein
MKLREIKIPKQITSLLILAVVLNILRVLFFGSTAFLYILWNIFLAFIPFIISSILVLHTNKSNISKIFFVAGFILWFLFLPNAPYVITDFIHLGRIHSVPVMFDIFVLFASAWVSLLMGLYSLVNIEKIFLLRFTKKITNIIMVFIILFASFGMYLGRYLRFNSWDFFVSHNFLITSIVKIMKEPNSNENMYAYTALFFVFIYISFISFKSTKTK